MTHIALGIEAYSVPPEPRSDYPFEMLDGMSGHTTVKRVMEVSFSAAEMQHIAAAHNIQEAQSGVLGWEGTRMNGGSATFPLLHNFVPWELSLSDRGWSQRKLYALYEEAQARLAESQPPEVTAALEELIEALAPLVPEDDDITTTPS